MSTTTSSTFEQGIEALFAKMAATWGSRFLDQWREVDMRDVKREWAAGLKHLSPAEFVAGVKSLLTLRFPPTLPEFVDLCKRTRLQQAQTSTFRLEYSAKANAQVVEKNLRAIHALRMPPKPSAHWAYKLLLNGRHPNNKPLHLRAKKIAEEAVLSEAGRKALREAPDELRERYEDLYTRLSEQAARQREGNAA